MADLSAQERLQPSLLDRLTDDHPRETKEPPESRALTRAQLRAAVLRDLSWLLNATREQPEPRSERQAEATAWQRSPQAQRSVLNFGLPAFAGETLSRLDLRAVERGVKQAIETFEPRIDPATLTVEVQVDRRHHHNALRLIIRGQMWNQPVPLELLLAAQVDVETGTASLRDMRA